MNELDIIILCFIAIGAIAGLFRGFLREVVGTIGILVAAVVANIASPQAMPYISGWISNETFAAIIVWTILFVIMMTLMTAIASMLSQFMSAIKLGWINRLAGAAFGAIKFCLISALVIFIIEIVISYVDIHDMGKYISGSKCVPQLHEMVDIIMPWCSEHILKPAIELLKK
ncbi:MAG: CvpA family protein [Bacteroidales bacterium]|nr:CvpA family protein [Bacteroidales bacterium]